MRNVIFSAENSKFASATAKRIAQLHFYTDLILGVQNTRSSVHHDINPPSY